MERVGAIVEVQDNATRKFNAMAESSNRATESFNKFTQSLSQNVSTVPVEKLNNSLTTTDSRIKSVSGGNFNGLTGSMNGFTSAVLRAGKALGILKGTQQLIKQSDNWANMTARLNMLDNGADGVAGTMEKIHQASLRARVSMDDMAQVTGKIGLLAGDKFKGVDEVLLFSETLAKSLKVSGATATETASAMHQITQALASGRLQGDEFRSIIENAPMYARALREEVGSTNFKKMAAEGKYTSEVMKNAMFRMADDVNKKIASMPMTFEDTMKMIKSNAQMGFAPLFEAITGIWNSEPIKQFAVDTLEIFTVIGSAGAFMVNTLVSGLTLVLNVVNFILPLLKVFGVVLLAVGVIMGIIKIMSIASAIGTFLYAGAMAIASVVIEFFNIATGKAVVAQNAFNLAMMNCPILRIVFLIILVVAAVVKLVQWLLSLAGISMSVVEIIGFGFGWLATAIGNVFTFVGNIGATCMEFIVNKAIDAVNGIIDGFTKFQNFFTMMGGAISAAASDMGTNIANGIIWGINLCIKGLNGLADALNKLPGINIGKTSLLSYKQSSAPQKIANATKKMQERTASREKIKAKHQKFDRFEYGNLMEGGKKGAETAKNLMDKLTGKDKKKGKEKSLEDQLKEYMKDEGLGDDGPGGGGGGKGGGGGGKGASNKLKKPLSDIEKNTRETAENTQNQKIDVRYLREIAERQAINRVTTNVVNVESSITAEYQDLDLDGFGDSLATKINDKITSGVNGVYDV